MLDTDVELNGAHFRIVGVMPASFNYPLSTNIWTPLPLSTDLVQDREKQSLLVIARLGPQATMGQARAEMNTIAAHLEQFYPKTNTGRRASVALLREQVAGDFTPMFLRIGLAGGSADRAGLKPGDLILGTAGTPIHRDMTLESLQKM